jgi:hypothetical protein
MKVEGRGEVPPAPVWIPLTRPDFIVIKEESIRRAKARDYRNRRDGWGSGLVGPGRPPNCADMRDDEYPIVIGCAGELACKYFFNQRMSKTVTMVDFGERPRGDRGIDLIACGLTFQVKGQQKPEQPGLIRRIDARGNRMPIPANIVIFTRFDREDPTGAWLLGWVWTREILALPVVPARCGDHRNIEVSARMYHKMDDVIKELRHKEHTQRWQSSATRDRRQN